MKLVLFAYYLHCVEEGLQRAKNATAVLFGDKKALLGLTGLFGTHADIVAGKSVYGHNFRSCPCRKFVVADTPGPSSLIALLQTAVIEYPLYCPHGELNQ